GTGRAGSGQRWVRRRSRLVVFERGGSPMGQDGSVDRTAIVSGAARRVQRDAWLALIPEVRPLLLSVGTAPIRSAAFCRPVVSRASAFVDSLGELTQKNSRVVPQLSSLSEEI